MSKPSKKQVSHAKPMSDAHIHAFVDRQLKTEREQRLQELVSAWPEKYEQVQEYQIISQRLIDGLADIYNQPIPKSIENLLDVSPKLSKPSVRDFLNSKTTATNKKSKSGKSTPQSTKSKKPPGKARINSVEPEITEIGSVSIDSAIEFSKVNEVDKGEVEQRTLDVDIPRIYGANILKDYLVTITAQTNKLRNEKVKLVATICLGIIIGWSVHNNFNAVANSKLSEVAQSAIDAHIFYTAESKHAVEVSAMHKKHLRNWIKSNLDSALEPVNLSKFNFELMGGRVLPLKGNAAGQYMYQNNNNKSRLTIYISSYLNDTSGSNPQCEQVESFGDGSLSICGWKKANLVFYVIANMTSKEITKVANRVKKLMPKKEKT